MSKFINLITLAWPYVLTGCGVIAALAGFIKLILEIKKLRLQVETLESEVQNSSNLIKVASEEDIKRYNKFMGDIEEKLSSTRSMMMAEIPKENYSKTIENAIHRLEKLFEEYKDETKRAKRKKQMEERQLSFKPNDLQIKIIKIIRKTDKIIIDNKTVKEHLPAVPMIEIFSALKEMANVGMFRSWGGGPEYVIYRLRGFGAKFISSYDKLTNKAHSIDAKDRSSD